jgi:subtilase family serine protease
MFALLISVSAIAQDAPAVARILNPIDDKQLVTLKGTMHGLATRANDRGAAPDEMRLERVHLVLQRSPDQESALRKLIVDMHTPGSASFHKWLTPEAFGKQFGPSDQDIATVETWLTGHGFNGTKVNPGKQTIEFSGNVRQFRNTFHAQIHKYEVNGESHYANAGDPQIPAALAPVISGFTSLNNFRVKSYAKYLGTAEYDPKRNVAKPSWTVGNPTTGYSFVLAPQDYAIQYDLAPLYAAGTKGAGQTIAIINEANINVALVNSFRTLFGLPANPPQVIIDGNDPGVDGVNNPDGANGASVEAYLDVEWAGAVAPGATVDLVIGGDTTLSSGLILAAEHAVYGNIAPVMSMSFGQCETNLGTSTNAFFNSLWEQAAAQGITVMVSSGDNGSAGCDDDNTEEYAQYGQAVNGFASTPYNVAVGGTDFYYSDFSQGLSAMEAQIGTYWSGTASNSAAAASILGVIPEQPWNDSQYGLTIGTLQAGSSPSSTSIAAGSGGTSSTYTTKPAWQIGFGDKQRDLPDVSLFASNGANASYYPICAVDGDCQAVSGGGTVQFSGVGGTSASSPSFAGIMALVNQKYGRQGQADFVLYPLSKQFPAAFHDVVAGTNSVPCAVSTATCLTVADPITITDQNGNLVTEGEIGNITTSTPYYNAAAGYDEASGLGTIDANQLVANWGSVKFTGTTTTFTPTTATTFAHGTAFKFDGTVKAAAGTATGNVALITDSVEPGQQENGFYTLSSGAFTGSTSTLPGGTYNVWAQYGGDATNALSASTPVSVTVSPESSGIAFNVVYPSGGGGYTPVTSGFTTTYGQQLDLSAQVAPPAQLSAVSSCTTTSCPYTIPTGTVIFSDNSSPINTALVNAAGEATYNAPFKVATHSVTAGYSGDASYAKSTAAPITFTVTQDNPVILMNGSIIDSDNGDSVNGSGQPTVITIQVENSSQYLNYQPSPVAAPTGTVTLTSSLPGLTPASQTLAAGVDYSYNAVDGIATFTVPAGSVSGTYNLTIAYSGDANYAATTDNSTITIEGPGTGGLNSAITGTVSGSILPTTSVTVSGTVTGQTGHAAPTGPVYVYSSGNYPTGANLVAGSGDTAAFTITLNSQTLFQGSNQITLQYFGDDTYYPSALVLTSPIVNPLSDFTLVPAAPIVPVTAGSNGSVAIDLSSMRGFSGSVSLTCSAASGVTCTIPTSESLVSGGSASATLQISAGSSVVSGEYDVLVTGKDSTGRYIHTLGIEALVTGLSSSTPNFTLSNTGDITITAGATTGNTSTVTATPSNAFTGTVALTCAVAAPTGATSPVTCTVPASVDITSATAVTGSLTASSTSTTTTGTYMITVTGTSGAISQTTLVNVTIVPVVPASYALSNSGAINVAPGATTGNTATISVTPSGGFTGTVALACAFASNAATDPATCSITPSVAITGTTALTATLTVTTTASASSSNEVKKLFWPSAGGATVCVLLFFGLPKRRRNWLAMIGLLVIFVGLAGMGCGGVSGGGGGGGGGNTGTTAGTYSITVTGTSGAASETTTVTLTVN